MPSKFLKLALIIPFLFLGCNNNDDNDNLDSVDCLFNEPIADLPWLTEKINETPDDFLKYLSIDQAVYQSEVVFIFRDCCPVCNTVSPIYTCNGELIGIVGTVDEFINPDLLINSKTIWFSDNFDCSLLPFPID